MEKVVKKIKKYLNGFKNNIENKKLKKAYKKLEKSYNELQEYKKLLEKKIEKEVEKRILNEKILEKQSRFAAMGEMMDAVAHQWMQPLSTISMRVNLMSDDFDDNLVDKKYLQETVDAINRQIDHLTATLKKFRQFFRPIDKQENFDVDVMIKETLTLLKDQIMKNKIDIDYKMSKTNAIIKGSSDEIKHILINLINNSKDAFEEKGIEDRVIKIRVKNRTKHTLISLEDNAGGIDETIIDDIFKPSVTTKKQGKGSGMGLYMSKLIMQKYKGEISVKNKPNGSMFLLKFYKGV